MRCTHLANDIAAPFPTNKANKVVCCLVESDRLLTCDVIPNGAADVESLRNGGRRGGRPVGGGGRAQRFPTWCTTTAAAAVATAAMAVNLSVVVVTARVPVVVTCRSWR